MRTITIRMNDLTMAKQAEIRELHPFEDIIDPDEVVTYLEIYDRDDLDLDIEKARVELELNNPEIH